MKDLIQRTITGILFVAIVTVCILYHPLSFGILFVAIIALTINEFVTLVNSSEEIAVSCLFAATSGCYLFFAVMIYCLTHNPVVFTPYLLLLMYTLIRELYMKQPYPLNNWAYTFMSQLYIALPFALLNVLAFYFNWEENDVQYQPIVPLAIFIFIWAYDSGAYCIGTLCGKHRLFLRISPKKSWEGVFGGALFAIVAALIVAHFFTFMTVGEWIGFALTVILFGTWGDLIESLFKRHLCIKDSGHILPGHGGWLDRFDSALLAIPAVVIYLCLLRMW